MYHDNPATQPSIISCSDAPQWSGDGTINELIQAPAAKLVLIHCYRSMNYICRTLEESYNMPWMEFNFFGPTRIAQSLREIAAKFDDKIKENAEKVIAKYTPTMNAVLDRFRPRLEGNTVMLYVGGLRPRHVVPAFEDLGIKVVGTGYEFGHNDDYKRTTEYVDNATIIYDDVTAYEFEEFVKHSKPDLVASGIKEKYVFQKMDYTYNVVLLILPTKYL